MTPFLSRTAGAFPHAFCGRALSCNPPDAWPFGEVPLCATPREDCSRGDQLLVWDAASDVTLVDPFGNRHGLRCIPPFRRDAFHSGIVACGDSIRGETVASLLDTWSCRESSSRATSSCSHYSTLGARRFECLPLLIVLLPTLASRMRVRGGPKVDRECRRDGTPGPTPFESATRSV